MTTPNLSWKDLLNLASELGCIGVEFRNDLATPLFSGAFPDAVVRETQTLGLRVVGLSQVYPFNDWNDDIASKISNLIVMAKACGAETISLIPRNDGTQNADHERQTGLRLALREIRPLLQESGLKALVEPLGFERSSLRSKAETIEAIEAVASREQFLIVHDTFHHFLAGGGPVYPEWTGIVHVSGVVNQTILPSEMEDAHRVLVDDKDRLGNIAQIADLMAGGYEGAFSFECFSPETHVLQNPRDEIRRSMDFIATHLPV